MADTQKPFNPFLQSEMISGGSRLPEEPFDGGIVGATIVPKVYKGRRDIPVNLAFKVTYRPRPDQPVTEDVIDYLNITKDAKTWAHSIDGVTPIDLPDEDALHAMSQEELDAFSGPYLIPRDPEARYLPKLTDSTAFAEWKENLIEAGWDEAAHGLGNSVECFLGIEGSLAQIAKKEKGFDKKKDEVGADGKPVNKGKDRILVFETVEKQASGGSGKKGGAGAAASAKAGSKGASAGASKPAGAATARPTAEIAEDLKEKVIAALAEAEDNSRSLSDLKSEILKGYAKIEATQALVAWNKAVRVKLWEGDGVTIEGDVITLNL